MKIAICDDNKNICNDLEKLLIEVDPSLLSENIIDVYYSGDELIKRLDECEVYDIVFLDIEMSPVTGIDVGRYIREIKNNNIIQIVFISHKDSYAMELFDIRPLNFLIKPFQKDKIEKVYFNAKKLITDGNKFFLFQKDNTTTRIPINEIVYFESENRKVNIITPNGKESFYGKIDEVCNQLECQCFLHIHKSYYINYYHIVKITYDKVRMSNGIVLNISQRRRKKIREQHLMYDQVENNSDI